MIVGKKLKAVTLGGPSGGVLPAQSIKIPLTYDDLGWAKPGPFLVQVLR